MSSVYERTPDKESFRNRALVFVDIETTGLDARVHEIIEIACLVVDPKTLEVTGQYHARVQPEHIETADPKALEINGYSEEVWRDARPIGQALQEINELSPGAMFAGWNVGFDKEFIEKAAREKEMLLRYDYHWIDVMPMVYDRLFQDKRIGSLSLAQVCEALGISLEKAHTATQDITATLAVYHFLKGV